MCRDSAAFARVAELLQQFCGLGRQASVDLENEPNKIEFIVPTGRREFVVSFTKQSHDGAGPETFSQRVSQAIREKKRHIVFSLDCLPDVASRPRAWVGNGKVPVTSQV